MIRNTALAAVVLLGLTACFERTDDTQYEQARRTAIIKIQQREEYERKQLLVARELEIQEARAQRKRDLDYIWRMSVERICGLDTTNEKFVVRGSDGHLWLADYQNPGRSWNSGVTGYSEPMDVLTPVSAQDPRMVCP